MKEFKVRIDLSQMFDSVKADMQVPVLTEQGRNIGTCDLKHTDDQLFGHFNLTEHVSVRNYIRYRSEEAPGNSQILTEIAITESPLKMWSNTAASPLSIADIIEPY